MSLCFDPGSHQTGCFADPSSCLLRFPDCCLLLPSCLSKAIPLCICMCFCGCVNHASTQRSIQFFDGTSRSSLIFPIDFLLLSFSHSQGIGCLNWSRRGEPRAWAIKKQIEDEGKRKVRGEKWRGEHKQGGEEPGGACGRHDRWGPRWPLTLIMTSEVAPEVRGCVKVPLRRFTPLLGDDDLMQPPQPVWHDQRCTLPAAPKGHTSIANPATQGPLKAPYRQSQWAGGKGTRTEKSGKAKGRKGCF